MLSIFEKHIIDLLHQHDCVIIPGLGGLVANYTPAFTDEHGKSLCPPRKGFIWNKFLQHNDGLLANEIVKKDEVSYDDAMAQVETFVQEVQQSLGNEKRFEFEQIGFLYLGDGGQIHFEYSGKNFLMNSFGLPLVRLQKLPVVQAVQETVKEAVDVVKLEPVKREEAKKEKVAKVIPIAAPETIERIIVKNSKWWIAAALIPIGFYTAWIPMKTDLLSGGDNFHYSDLNPFTYNKEKGSYTMVSNLDLTIDTLPSVSFEPLKVYEPDSGELLQEENHVLAPESTYVDVETPETNHANVTLGNYFVIGGCFSDEENAIEFINQLKEQGYPAVKVDVNKGLHRVAFGQYTSKEEAKSAKKQITSSGDFSAWVLKK